MSDTVITDKPFVGWRRWRWDGFRFVSNFGGAAWLIGDKAEAVCQQHIHTPPDLNCTCGVYAYKRKESASADIFYGRYMGEVWLWGKIVEHEDGYRAQFAYPKSIYIPTWSVKEAVVYAMSLYGVDVFVNSQIETHLLWSKGQFVDDGAFFVINRMLQRHECRAETERALVKVGDKVFVGSGNIGIVQIVLDGMVTLDISKSQYIICKMDDIYRYNNNFFVRREALLTFRGKPK